MKKQQVNQAMKNENDIAKQLYEICFLALSGQLVTVFLCGRAYDKKNPSLRDKIKPILETEKVYGKRIRVLYPEEMIMDYLDRYKDCDLLYAEKVLADNSDVIVVICESPGSLVELGAFSNNVDTSAKLIACVNQKYRKQKSFIIKGPIKYLENHEKDSVYYYSNDEHKDEQEIFRKIRQKYKRKVVKKKLSLDTAMGMYYYTQILLYFFDELNSIELSSFIKQILEDNSMSVDKFDIMFQMSINMLYRDGFLCRKDEGGYSCYYLSPNGRGEIDYLLSEYTKVSQRDKIRMMVLYNRYYRAPQS